MRFNTEFVSKIYRRNSKRWTIGKKCKKEELNNNNSNNNNNNSNSNSNSKSNNVDDEEEAKIK